MAATHSPDATYSIGGGWGHFPTLQDPGPVRVRGCRRGPRLPRGWMLESRGGLHLLLHPERPTWCAVNDFGLETALLADGSRYFDFSPDGQRFLMFQSEIQASERDHEHIRVVLNWFDELEARVPGRQ